MLSEAELKSLVALLDDNDPEVNQLIEDKIFSIGSDMIPFLETEWALIHDLEHQKKVENIIHRIQFEGLKGEFQTWFQSESPELLEGCYLIARYQFPALQKQVLINAIEKIRLDAWLELHYELSPAEKIRTLNYIIYQIHGFRGNTKNYHDPKNSYINQVLESKQGNPILLAVIYMLVAQKLNIPIFGVNLPQHFVLVYLDDASLLNIERFKSGPQSDLKPEGKVLFYINAFNQGAVFTKTNLEQFLHQVHIEPQQAYFEPCTTIDIIKRILRNLVSAYEKVGKTSKQNDIQTFLYLLGEPPLLNFREIDPDDGTDF